MTDQEIFDTVLFNLLRQGKSSVRDDENGYSKTCAYRGDDGSRCAAGWCIPDELYDSGMEGMAIDDVAAEFQAIGELFGTAGFQVRLLEALQDAHDSYMPVSKGGDMSIWESKMARIATDFGLKYTPADSIGQV